MDLIFWSVRLPSWKGEVGVSGVVEIIVILARCEYHFIRVHENQVQHPSNDKDQSALKMRDYPSLF